MKKTHEQFVKELSSVNPNIEVLGVYVKAREPIFVRCKIDNYEWFATPDNLLRGKGCKICGVRASSNAKKKSFIETILFKKK